ncbi:MAG TPA: TIGR01620 family protein [Devosia sp.]|mgnify:CR=1 FL=1|nr:TIGR01620 family protein [Devosia sp.]
MKGPVARTIGTEDEIEAIVERRAPRAFAAAEAASASTAVETFVDASPDEIVPARPPGFLGFFGKLAWGAGGILVSLALGLAADRLIRDLFASNEWLGWLGVAVLVVLGIALFVLLVREVLSLARLRNLNQLRKRAEATLASDIRGDGAAIVRELEQVYAGRPDLARQRDVLTSGARELFDGGEYVRLAERTLMAPLDARARALTAASARRVALVTAVSPRALIDIAFVVFESVRLGGDIARLYGARPGLFGSWRLVAAILSHLAVTGGLVLTDGVVEQLLGQGLASRLSARLGEGIVNGLMTVRVGIAAMRVVRPLPFDTQRQPVVRDFIPELANVLQKDAERAPGPAK